MRSETVRRVIRAYDDWIVRGYCWGRFWILRQRFLDEIGQYLPERGRVLDNNGAVLLAQSDPRASFDAAAGRLAHKFDLAPGATAGVYLKMPYVPDSKHLLGPAARRLGLANVSYDVGDVMDFRGGERVDAVYMLDIVHHIPADAVRPLLEQVAKVLPAGGLLLIKDVDRTPAYKRWFTHVLDKVMDPGTPVRYWDADELMATLTESGFGVRRHLMVDILPYPHILYICVRQ